MHAVLSPRLRVGMATVFLARMLYNTRHDNCGIPKLR
jgi:hypothetical protein